MCFWQVHGIVINIKATQSYLIACDKQELELDRITIPYIFILWFVYDLIYFFHVHNNPTKHTYMHSTSTQ